MHDCSREPLVPAAAINKDATHAYSIYYVQTCCTHACMYVHTHHIHPFVLLRARPLPPQRRAPKCSPRHRTLLDLTILSKGTYRHVRTTCPRKESSSLTERGAKTPFSCGTTRRKPCINQEGNDRPVRCSSSPFIRQPAPTSTPGTDRAAFFRPHSLLATLSSQLKHSVPCTLKLSLARPHASSPPRIKRGCRM